MSIEAFTATNLLMNFILLTISARCIGHIRWKRVMSASIFGTVYALVVYMNTEKKWLQSLPLQMLCLLGMAWILFGSRSVRNQWKGFICLVGSVVFAGGVMTLLNRWFPSGSGMLALTGWSVILLAAFLSDGFRDGIQVRNRVEIRIQTRMGGVTVRALVDTGNRLREPLSGLPVIVVEAERLKEILDEVCLKPFPKRLLPGFRRVGYSVLGGQGELIVFRPESVFVRNGQNWSEAPDVWIGIYQGELPSSVEALAPPIFGEAQIFSGKRVNDLS